MGLKEVKKLVKWAWIEYKEDLRRESETFVVFVLFLVSKNQGKRKETNIWDNKGPRTNTKPDKTWTITAALQSQPWCTIGCCFEIDEDFLQCVPMCAMYGRVAYFSLYLSLNFTKSNRKWVDNKWSWEETKRKLTCELSSNYKWWTLGNF